jgi:hypothetical protein
VDLVPLLQAEVLKLKEMLRLQQEEQVMTHSLVGPRHQEEVVLKMQQRVTELEKELADRESLIESLEIMRLEGANYRADSLSTGLAARSFVKKRSKAVSSRNHPLVVLADDAIDTGLPRIVNLNQDPLFSECLVYYLPVGITTAGSEEESVDVLISGPDVLPRHCSIHNDGETLWVEPIEDAKVYLNGEVVPARSRVKVNRVLNHLDRITLGRFHLFRFEAKGKDSGRMSFDKTSRATDIPGWEFAQEELMRMLSSEDSPKDVLRTRVDVTTISELARGINDHNVTRVVDNSSHEGHRTQAVMHTNDVRATMPLTSELPLTLSENKVISKSPPSSRRNSSTLDSQYEEIFSRARRQLESIAQNGVHSSTPSPLPFEVSSAKSQSKITKEELFLSSHEPEFSFKDPSPSQWQKVGHSNYSKHNEPSTIIAGLQHTNTSVPDKSIVSETTVIGSVAFEKEALELQAELAQMQRTLQDRMRRYSILTKKP